MWQRSRAESSPIRTVTVGSGFAPDPPLRWTLTSRALKAYQLSTGHGLGVVDTPYRRSGIAPCPEDSHSISLFLKLIILASFFLYKSAVGVNVQK